ncbi:MAG: MerR family transcriptional regulator [Acidobacteriota bacterium]|nr:MerR family transcriptional regulator [Acidobacteriota bacterium]
MVNSAPSMSIGVLARAAGVNIETIRYYQRKGLLAVPARQRGEIRRYGRTDLARVRFVKAAQRLGFTLDEVAGLMTLGEGADCGKARLMAERKLRDVRARLEDLGRLASALESLVADCAAARQTPECPLIAALQSEVAAR